MRIAVITVSVFAGLVMIEHAVIPLRVMVLLSSGVRPHDAVSSVALFCVWSAATALVYPYPAVAVWLFAIGGVFGLFDGLSYGIEVLILWGSVALVLAVLTTFARREKLIADQIDWVREQHVLAVHAAMRSLQESAPELLSRVPEADQSDPRPIAPSARRPTPHAVAATARRAV